MRNRNRMRWLATLALLAVGVISPYNLGAAVSGGDFKVRVSDDKVCFKIDDNTKTMAQVEPRLFYDGWKFAEFLTPEEDSPYDGIATLPGGKRVGVKASYEYLKDGIHVRYVMTPLDDVSVLRVQAEVDYDYPTWVNSGYQFGEKTGIVPEKKVKDNLISDGDDELLTLGPAKDSGDLTADIKMSQGLHTVLEDDRQWWPKLAVFFTHGEKFDKVWNWKKGEEKVFDFTVDFNRQVIAIEKNEPKDIAELKKQMDALINPIVKDKWSPCMVVGVLYKGQTAVFGYGKTDLKNGHKPDGDTVFDVGSITKLFTKLLLSDMVQRSQMKLDDPAQKYAPSELKLPTKNGVQMTLVQLAEHYSGLDFLPTDIDLDKDPDAFSHYSLSHFYQYLSNYQLLWLPGDNYQYSNTGMALLGAVLARKNGTTYEEYLKKRILDPLGMTDSGITWTPAQDAQAATPYYLDNVKTEKGDWTERTFDGAGALHSSANDLLKFAQAALYKDNPVLGNIAFGDAAKRLDWGGKAVQHGGNVYGYNTSFYLDRKEKVALVVLSNNGSTSPASKVAEKLGYVLHGIEADPVDYPKLVEVPKSQLKPYVGRYIIEECPDKHYVNKYYDIRIEKGHLLSEQEDTKRIVTIYQTKKGGFYTKSGAYAFEFIKDAKGRVIGAKPTEGGYYKYLLRKLDASNQPLVDSAWPKGKTLLDSNSLLVDDFESGTITNKLGGTWKVELDDRKLGTILKNGKDFIVKEGHDSHGSARIYGHIGRSVAPWPYADLYTSLSTNDEPVDLSAYKGIEFWAKGDGKKYDFTIHTTPMDDFCYFRHDFTAPKEWTKVHIDFSDMTQRGWGKEIFRDLRSVKRILFTMGDLNEEDFDLSIDDVMLVK